MRYLTVGRVIAVLSLCAVGPLWAQEAVTAGGFNPAISLILDGRFSTFENDPEAYALPGFQLGGEAGLGAEGFALGHNELSLSANVDPHFHGLLTLAIADHEGATEVELEEALIETLAAGPGLTVRAGRFFSGIGYLNGQHGHAWDFVDAPLVYRALFGDQLRDDGVQVRWVAPTGNFLQFGAELFRGGRFPAGGGANDGHGAQTLFLKTGGDLGASQSWQLGLSRWQAQVAERAGGGHDHAGGATEVPTFSGESAINGVDGVWKWAPVEHPGRALKLQAEYFVREEQGEVSMVGSVPPESTTYDGRQSGWYLQAIWQFTRAWRAGLRYDRLQARNDGSDPALLEEAGLAQGERDPTRAAVMVDYAGSEFSRWRLQYNHDESATDPDHQIYLQYVMSLGAHGAHKF